MATAMTTTAAGPGVGVVEAGYRHTEDHENDA